MTNRIFLDANVILNATFVPASWSRLVVDMAASRGALLFTGPETIAEAETRTQEYAHELGKTSNPSPVINAFLRLHAVIAIPATAFYRAPVEIPKNDKHVVNEAIAANAEILTNDGELWLACKKVGVPALLPLELLRRFDADSLSTTIFGVPPKRDMGSIFFRGYPGGWAGMSNVGKFTAIDFPGLVWIYYCSSVESWVADIPGIGTLSVPVQTSKDLQTVGLTWQSGERISLRVATIEHPDQEDFSKPLRGAFGTHFLGSHHLGANFWNGAVYACVTNDQPIGKDAWKTYCLDRELTPNPFDSNRLRSAIDANIR